MTALLEQNEPIVQYQGLNTNKAAVFGGTTTFNGAVVYTGTKSGGVQPVVTGGATLTAAQSGSICLFNTAAGLLYTLPAASVGLSFDFFVSTTATSLTHKVITSAGTIFLLGAISYGLLDTTPGSTAGPKFTAADGSTMVSIAMNGTTTGGIAGTYFTVKCITATQWLISGLVIASGTIATPFATS